MKKNLLTLGVLAISFSASAQVLTHVGNDGTFYIGENALVYNGGGVQTKATGQIDVHGNMMIVGNGTSDVLKTVDAANADKLLADGGANIILRLNKSLPAAADYDAVSYGQLYIDGITQINSTAIVDKEYQTAANGSGNYFQQVALPFYNKQLSTLSGELGKTFGVTRFTQNEILKWDNVNAVSNHYTNLATSTTDPTGYYMLGSKANNLNTSTALRTLKGMPYASISSITTLENGGNVNFGPGGNNNNAHNEKYNTYIQDRFERVAGTAAWTNRYGKDIYQFGNPFFTNIDLSLIGYDEDGVLTGDDGNNITNIWGVKTTAGTVSTLPSGTTYTTNATLVTFDPVTHIPIADVPTLIIKPMQSFVIKLRNTPPVAPNLDFNTLRRFKSTVRPASTIYGVNSKSGTGTVKQLGVIGLDSNGTEIARTYYVVSPTMVTGNQPTNNTTVQAMAEAGGLKTFEEDPINGMYDTNHMNYTLYINEANEVDFLGKPVPLALYNSNISSLKFEIRENAELVPDAQQDLSTGIAFYYKTSAGVIAPIAQNMTIATNGGTEFGLSYGPMTEAVLNTAEIVKVNRTVVVFSPAIDNYVVQFDPKWKTADVQVYDMSGKIVVSAKNVKTAQDFVINLSNKIQGAYIVTGQNEKGETFTSKIIR